MWSNSVSIAINAPAEQIYTYLADFTRHAEWSTNVTKIELIGGEGGKVGAEYKAQESAPRDLTSFARITDLRPPNLIGWESTDHKVFRTNWTFEITPNAGVAPDSSTLTQSVTFHPLTFIANIILYIFRVPVVQKENLASLQRIKSKVEP